MDTYKKLLKSKSKDELVDFYNLLKNFYEKTEEYLYYGLNYYELRKVLIYGLRKV